MAICTVFICFLTIATAHGDVDEGFEAADTAWKLSAADCSVKTLSHERTWNQSHSGIASEHLLLALGTGNEALWTYDIKPAHVIQDLSPSLWLKSDRVGLRLYARIVLPRSKEPRTGRPLTALVTADGPAAKQSIYSDAGVWQRLVINDVPLQLERQLRVLRKSFGPNVDARDAYVDKLVLNTYSQPGVVNLWIDDLEVTGHVPINVASVRQASHNDSFASADQPNSDPPRVALDGAMLLADQRPLAVRMIEHQGESLEWLQSMGFNAVMLRQSASQQQLADSRRLGLWLVSPPTMENGRIVITPDHQGVLAWLLGLKLGPGELESARALADELRSADSRAARPTLVGAHAPLGAYSRIANVLMLEPPALCSSLELSAYADFFSARQRLARSGAPIWTTISTESPPALELQARAIGPREATYPLDYQQLRLLTFTAVASGVRGICFASATRLDAQDATSQQRADMLRLLNAELRLVEPWMAGGAPGDEVTIDDQGVRVGVLQTQRARLLIVRRYESGQQWALGAPLKNRTALVIPGTPSSSHVYRLTTLGMTPLIHKRVTGGTRIEIENAGACSLVVISQDPLVLERVAKDLASLEADHARLHYNIVARRQADVSAALRGIPAAAFPPAGKLIQDSSTNLQQARRQISAGDRRGAARLIALAEEQLAGIERGHWLAATKAFASPAESPFCANFGMLPAHYGVAERLRGTTFGANLLAGGEMENLDTLVQSGWRHQRDPNVPVEAGVELAPQPGGESALHLRVYSSTPEAAPAVVESPPIWVTTPRLPVARGKFVRIRGSVRTSEIAGSQDGLLIFDSLGGQALAHRIQTTNLWQTFTLYRAVPEDASLSVTFALTGLGDAWIDNVEISLLDLPPARNIAAMEPAIELMPPRRPAEELPAPMSRARGWKMR